MIRVFPVRSAAACAAPFVIRASAPATGNNDPAGSLGIHGLENVDSVHRQRLAPPPNAEIQLGPLGELESLPDLHPSTGLARASGFETLTAPRSLLGTCRYMSPEQLGEPGTQADPRVDVYALGATMYELLALRPMFAGTDDRELLNQALHKEPVPPGRLIRQVPREL